MARRNDVLEHQARQKFADHVQSIAFNLTLSRRMVNMLQIIRDQIDGVGDGLDPENVEAVRRRKIVDNVIRSPNGAMNSYTLYHSLETRGLVYRPERPNKNNAFARENLGTPFMLLTRAGELVCELLVEAGLMAPAAKQRKVA